MQSVFPIAVQSFQGKCSLLMSLLFLIANYCKLGSCSHKTDHDSLYYVLPTCISITKQEPCTHGEGCPFGHDFHDLRLGIYFMRRRWARINGDREKVPRERNGSNNMKSEMCLEWSTRMLQNMVQDQGSRLSFYVLFSPSCHPRLSLHF